MAVATGASPLAAQFDGPEADIVRQREIAFAQTMVDRDFTAFLAFIHEDAIFFAGGRALRGRVAIGEWWRRMFDGLEAPITWVPDQVQVLDDGSLALSTGPVTRADGSLDGRFNSVWRRDADGVWRVVFDKGS